MEYVKEHLTDPDLSLKELGDRFNLSVSAVSKLFKRVCGINFYDFLLSGRMELACEMLENKKSHWRRRRAPWATKTIIRSSVHFRAFTVFPCPNTCADEGNNGPEPVPGRF